MTQPKYGIPLSRKECLDAARKARSSKDPALRFWPKVNINGTDECWPWMAAKRRKDEGYGAFCFKGKHRPASRIAYILTNGEIADDLVVCHKCDNPPCCNPNHLFLGTRHENDLDKVAKKRSLYGEKNPNASLTEELVIEMRKLDGTMSIRAIALRLGVTYPATWQAIRRQSWRHIP